MNRLSKLVLVLFLLFGSLSLRGTDVQAEGNIEGFVTRLYTLCLNRTPDAKGKADWVNQLRSGQKSAAEVVRGFFFSNEMKNRNLSDGEYVETCYRVMMNRGSDANGKYYWSDKILYQDRSVVVKGFIDSQEFTNICKQYGLNKGTINTDTTNKGLQLNNSERIHCEGKVKEFVERCYTKTLGRASDTTGLNHWIKKITNGEYTPARVAAEGFYHSKEFVSKYTSNEEYIKILYRTFLGREAEASGYTYWLEQIKTKSRDQILNGFANSKEFSGIIHGYAIDLGCAIGTMDEVERLKILYPNVIITDGRKDGGAEAWRLYDLDTDFFVYYVKEGLSRDFSWSKEDQAKYGEKTAYKFFIPSRAKAEYGVSGWIKNSNLWTLEEMVRFVDAFSKKYPK